MFGGEPAQIPEHLVDALRQHVEGINASGSGRPPLFRQGDAVMIRDGPFSGCEAIFDVHIPGRQRAQVLLSFIQVHRMRLELPIQHLDTLNDKTQYPPAAETTSAVGNG
jgi:transcription antitermination factor NusG